MYVISFKSENLDNEDFYVNNLFWSNNYKHILSNIYDEIGVMCNINYQDFIDNYSKPDTLPNLITKYNQVLHQNQDNIQIKLITDPKVIEILKTISI